MSIKATVYIVSTPIGNLQDITLRAIETLKSVDVVVCEDTRVSSRLLQEYDISKPLRALNDFNEENELPAIIGILNEGKSIALISDAGTPLVSDPGYRLIREAIKRGFPVIPIPGASSILAALTVSGLSPDKFLFLGFLPKSRERKKKVLTETQEIKIDPTIILFESPQRIIETLETILEVYGNISVVLARELTKVFEETKRDTVKNLIEEFRIKQPKGEFVILFRAD